MSLNQKYTWADFLRDNPDMKGTKRTSPEGKKAFEAAFKKQAKEYLKARAEKMAKGEKIATEKRDALVTRLKAAKRPLTAKTLQARVGQKDRAIAGFQKQIERTKSLQKSL